MRFLISSILGIILVGLVQGQENYRYKVRYGFVSAGSASLEYRIKPDSLSSRFVIRSSSWLSHLWRLNDSIESEYDLLHKRLISHTKHIREGRYKKNYTARFFWEKALLTVNKDSLHLENTALVDVPSLLYRLRQTRFTVGDTVRYSIFDGRSQARLSLWIEKMERIDVGSSSVLSYLLQPLERTEKADENELYLKLWLSADKPHIPVQMAIATRFGNVVMVLVTD